MSSKTRLGGCAFLAVGAVLFSSVPAHAGILVAVQFVSAGIGTSGNIDVTLTNTGAAAVTIGAFDFNITTSNTNIVFTGTNTSTSATYIFAGDSLFGPNINTIGTPGQVMDGFDLAASGGDAVGAGSTVGLGHVLFDVSAGATAGAFAVDLVPFPTTNLSDSVGNNIPIGTLTPGQITITGTAVPEPASSLLLGGALLCLGLKKRRPQPNR